MTVDPLVSTLALIVIALVGARFSFSNAPVASGPRLLFRTGIHFLFMGFLLGPSVLGFIEAEAALQLRPLLELGLGWVGLLFGLQLDRRALSRFPPGLITAAVAQAAVAFALFLLVGWALLDAVDVRGDVIELLVLSAAATACVSTPAGIALISTNFFVRGAVSDFLLFVASLDAVVGIIALQVIYSLYQPAEMILGLGQISALVWIPVALALGVAGGVVFLWLTRPQAKSEELVLFLLGIAAYASGAALHLQLSLLLVAVVLGATLANLSPERRRIYRVLQRWEKAIYVIFLLLAGALLRFSTPWILPLALAYAAVRGASKLAANLLVVRAVPLPFRPPASIGLGLLPQGGISLAMAVSVVLTYAGTSLGSDSAVDVFFAIVVSGVILSELLGPFLTIRLLRRVGEISPLVEDALATGDEAEARRVARRRRTTSVNRSG